MFAETKKPDVKTSQAMLNVLTTDDGKSVFSENGGVQGLETVLAAVLGQLVYSSKSAELHSGLLKKFYWDFDNKWYVLEIQDNLKFHNGRTVTSEDLEFSLVRGLLSKKGSWFKSFFSNVEGIEAAEGKTTFKSGMILGIQKLNSHSIRVKLSSPNPSFLHSLARSYFSIVPREELKDDYLTWKKFPVGAGPYKIVSSEQDGSTIKLVKVSSDNKGPATICISSSLKLSPIDISFVNSKETEILQHTVSENPTSVTGIYFNFENELGRNPDFRKAIAYAVARSKIVGSVTSYFPANELLSSQFWGRTEEKEIYNPEKAKQLVEKIKPLLSAQTIHVPVFRSEFGNDAFGAYIFELQNQLKDVGIDVVFEKSEKKFFDESDRKTALRILSLGSDLADPTVLFGLFRKGSPMQPHFPENDLEYEKLFVSATKASSLDTKSTAVKALSKYFSEQVYAVPLFERRSTLRVNNKRVKSLGAQDGGLALYLDRVIVN